MLGTPPSLSNANLGIGRNLRHSSGVLVSRKWSHTQALPGARKQGVAQEVWTIHEPCCQSCDRCETRAQSSPRLSANVDGSLHVATDRLGNDCTTAAGVERQGLATPSPRPPADSSALRRNAASCETLRGTAPDPELTRVTEAWTSLPYPLKAAILAMVGTVQHDLHRGAVCAAARDVGSASTAVDRGLPRAIKARSCSGWPARSRRARRVRLNPSRSRWLLQFRLAAHAVSRLR